VRGVKGEGGPKLSGGIPASPCWPVMIRPTGDIGADLQSLCCRLPLIRAEGPAPRQSGHLITEGTEATELNVVAEAASPQSIVRAG